MRETYSRYTQERLVCPCLFIERATDANAERESGRFQSFSSGTPLKLIVYIPRAGLIYRLACDLDEF